MPSTPVEHPEAGFALEKKFNQDGVQLTDTSSVLVDFADKPPPFAMFASRRWGGKSHGWQYLGSWRSVEDEDGVQPVTRCCDMNATDKKSYMTTMMKSAKAKDADAWGKRKLLLWRNKLVPIVQAYKELCVRKPGLQEEQEKMSQYLQKEATYERRAWSETFHKECAGQPMLAAQAVALGYDDMAPTIARDAACDSWTSSFPSWTAFGKLLVQLDEFHVGEPVEFVYYDSKLYDYMSGAPGDLKNPISKWYDWKDQQV